MAIIRVGKDRHYSTVQTGVDNADDGDTVLIDPGRYNEDIIVPRLISLRGASVVPENGDIRIYSTTDNPAIQIRLDSPATASGTIYIEGIEAETTYGNWIRTIGIKSITADSPNLHVVINKCNILCSGKHFPVGMDTNTTKLIGELRVERCYLKRGYAHTVWFSFINYTEVTNTIVNNTFSTYSGDPDVTDVVVNPTEEYGPAYGNFYNKLELYYFQGHTKDRGVPVSRVVRAVARDYTFTTYSGGSIFHGGSVVSYPEDGFFTIITSYDGVHDIYCEDDSAGVNYNDLLYSKVVPIPCPL